MKGLDPLYFVFDYSTTPSKEEQGWVYNQRGSEASEAVLSGEKRMICVCDLQSWQSSLPYWNSTRYPYVKWTDIKVDENKFIRNIGDYKFYVENGVVSYWERYYQFSDMLMSYNEHQSADPGSWVPPNLNNNCTHSKRGTSLVLASSILLW